MRSETALIQTIGRAARNVDGRVILYADKITNSMEAAMSETERRRGVQEAYNKKHGITPAGIKKAIKSINDEIEKKHKNTIKKVLEVEQSQFDAHPYKYMKGKKAKMEEAVERLDFETAAILRDEIVHFQKIYDAMKPKDRKEPKKRKVTIKKGRKIEEEIIEEIEE